VIFLRGEGEWGEELAWTRTHTFRSKISKYHTIPKKNIFFSLRFFDTFISFNDIECDRQTDECKKIK
jgi:hypothetical protein